MTYRTKRKMIYAGFCAAFLGLGLLGYMQTPSHPAQEQAE